MASRLPLAASLLLLVTACGGSSDGNGSTAPEPGFGLSVSPSTLTIVVGEVGQFDVSITRTGGFAGEVSVLVDNLPRGVTSGTLLLGPGESSGAIDIVVSSSADPVVWEVTVRASASGLTTRSTDATLVTRIVT